MKVDLKDTISKKGLILPVAHTIWAPKFEYKIPVFSTALNIDI